MMNPIILSGRWFPEYVFNIQVDNVCLGDTKVFFAERTNFFSSLFSFMREAGDKVLHVTHNGPLHSFFTDGKGREELISRDEFHVTFDINDPVENFYNFIVIKGDIFELKLFSEGVDGFMYGESSDWFLYFNLHKEIIFFGLNKKLKKPFINHFSNNEIIRHFYAKPNILQQKLGLNNIEMDSFLKNYALL